MRSIWNGAISFGLINVPVKMFTATEDKDLRFRLLHKACQAPLKQKRVCSACGQEVAWDDTVRGYEWEPGRFTLITEEELDGLQGAASRSIDILDFVNLEDIDPIYFHKTYYLAPSETGKKAYHLLRTAMEETGKIAVGKVHLREKQHLVTLRVIADCIVMALMFYPDEIRDAAEVPAIHEAVVIQDAERRMALELIERLAEPFVAAKYTDTYRGELLALLTAKAEGGEISAVATQPAARVGDLMEALRASLALVDEQRRKAIS
ncbi:MAG: Ku protein [Selenomonadales bacterium]|jgi:DNA end-binding protein Ku|nr:Ku protein [Selenomonadales bacterium]